MAKVIISTDKRYSLHLSDLSEYQIKFIQAVFQNSPNGYHLADEPDEERELREAIFAKCAELTK